MARGSDSNPKVYSARIAVLLLCFTVLPGFFISSQTTTGQHPGRFPTSPAALPNNRPFDYILIILMENKNFSQINGSPSAPYLNQLAQNYSLLTRYTACDHPSLPNYMCLTGANNYFSGINCSPTGSCTTSNPSIVDRVENAGLTWRAYMEDMPFPCYKSISGNYTYLTNPFVFYTQISNNSTRCTTHVVPANPAGRGLPDNNLVNDLASTSTASNYMWLTPNLCDNMHNCPISIGDSYLSKLVPQILNSTVFKTQKAALFITFDEGYGRYPTDYVYSIWAGPAVKTQYQSSIEYSHYSLPRTIEAAWGLQPLTVKEGMSPAMLEIFLSPTAPPPAPVPIAADFTFSPSAPDAGLTISFSGSAIGGTQPYVYKWSFGDGDRSTGQTIEHVYPVAGNYTASLTVADASGQTAATSHTIFIDTDPSPTGTCQGCTKTTFPRTLGLMISLVIGVALPLAGSMIISRRHQRTVRTATT